MNLKNILTIIVVLLTWQKSNAQFNLQGKVQDAKTNKSIPKASVYINELKLASTADANGYFSFGNIQSGTYLIEIQNAGYSASSLKIKLNADTTCLVKLQKSVTELNTVIITAVSRATEIKKSPLIINTLNKQKLNENSNTNIVDALRNIPGINQITTGVGISKPIVRGLGYNRVITLHNGIKQEGQQWGDEHGIEIDAMDVSKVEIVKGPGSLMYGSDGIAGVINFIAANAPAKNTFVANYTTNYQSNNNLITNSVGIMASKNDLRYGARLTNKNAGNYANAIDGKVWNAGFKEWNGSAMLGVNKKWGHSYFNFSSYNNTLNLVEGERDSTGAFVYIDALGNELTANDKIKGFALGFPHQLVQHNKISNNSLFFLKNAKLHVDLAFQNNKRKEYAEAANPNDIELFFDLNTINYNARLNFKEKNKWETTIGISGMQQGNKNKGEEFLIPEYTLLDAGIFAFAQKELSNKLVLAAGLRADNRNMRSNALWLDTNGAPTMQDSFSTIKFYSFTKNYAGLSGSLGLSYQLNKTNTLKVNASRGYRAPNIAELASNGKHEGSFRYEIGNPNLLPEYSNQLDLAYYLQSEHVSISISPFVNYINNYIYTQKLLDAFGNDSIPDPSEPAPAFLFTQGNARLIGTEIYTDFHPHPLDWLHIENTFGIVNAKLLNQTDSTSNLPFIPAAKYNGELKAELAQNSKTLSNTYVKFGLQHFFAQRNVYSAFGTETATPAYTLLHLGAGTNIAARGRKDFFTININADNITNAVYQSHLSRLKYAPINPANNRTGVFNMGRNISVQLIMQLQGKLK